MRIAICHYHLQRGGVTRIILHTVRALQARGIRVAVLSGEAPPSSWGIPCRIVRELHYDNITGGTTTDVLYRRMLEAAADAIGSEPDIWHFHNHSLGKNLALPGVIRKLADQGKKLLLQIHDFPEDGRPMNYSRQMQALADGDRARLSEILYPSASHIHYALLNSRDLGFMHEAGADTDTLHLLPNPVEIKPAAAEYTEPCRSGKRLWLYPTRAIRRKNIGEFLLWSAGARGNSETFALTMAPENPAEKPFYQNWKALSAELDLPVQFEFGSVTGLPFSSMLSRAHAVVTTSIAEGFGMAFLEPWLMNRPVCGRDLPEITDGFRQCGISLPWMYSTLLVPSDMLDTDTLIRKIRKVQADYLSAYSWNSDMYPLPPLDEVWIQDGMIDFGRLDEKFQASIIRKLRGRQGRFAELQPDSLPDPGNGEEHAIEKNRGVIEQHFSLENYGRGVIEIYRELYEEEPRMAETLDGTHLLENFLAPERLTMLRMAL